VSRKRKEKRWIPNRNSWDGTNYREKISEDVRRNKFMSTTKKMPTLTA
jgi:hypothetical protein